MSELINPQRRIYGGDGNGSDKRILNKVCLSWEKRTTRQNANERLVYKFPCVPPATCMEFQRDWSRHCKNPRQRIKYLSLITPEHLDSSLLAVEMDAQILCEICDTLYWLIFSDDIENSDLMDKKIDFVMQWMCAITTCDRLDLHIAFMTKKEKEATREICEWLIRNCDSANIDLCLEDIRQKFIC